QLIGQLEQQLGLQKQFLESYRKSVISAFTDVEKALIAIQETTRQERLQAEAVAASRRAFELSEAQLKAGTVNLITVLQTEQTLFTTLDVLAQVRFARFRPFISLYQALGGGGPPRVFRAQQAVERAVGLPPPLSDPSPNP